MDRLTTLRLNIQARKDKLRRKRVRESDIAEDKQLIEWQQELDQISEQSMSPLLESSLREFILDNQGSENLDRILKRHLIDVALVMSYGNQSKAARMLGIDRGTIQNFLGKY